MHGSSTPIDIAKDYISRGWSPIPIPHKAKGPIGKNWQRLKVTLENVTSHFNGGEQNIGVHLGAKSGGLTDIDFDCKEAVALAPHFLPSTNAVFGRDGKPRGHWLYYIEDPNDKAVTKLNDADGACIIELRTGGGDKGAQTVFPGSTHTSGEKIAWVSDGDPARTTFSTLREAVTKIAVATILIRAFPVEGSRHQAALALGGFLARAGWEADYIGDFVRLVAHLAGSNEPDNRAKDAVDAAENHANCENVYGLPGLKEFFGEGPAKAVAKLLNYREMTAGHGPSPEGTISVVPGELPRIVDEAEAALLKADCGIYQRGTMLVRPAWVKLKAADNRETSALSLFPIDGKYLAEALTKLITFKKWNESKERYASIDCPDRVVLTYLARVGDWKLPVIAGVINAPCLRYDGSILDKPGYDAVSGLLFDPNGVEFPPIPESPTKDDAQAALKVIKNLLKEFPFVGEVDRSAALSQIFTALDRKSIRLAPIHATTAPTAGTGKTYLNDMASMIVTGNIAPVVSQGWNDDELEKRLTSALISGRGIIAIDNCVRPVGGAFLCAMVTSEYMNLRILGKSEEVTAPTNALVTVNGNNLGFNNDITRRIVLCRLDANLENPESKKFGGQPLEEIKRRRGEIVAAGLTVLRAYHVAKPTIDLPQFASFEDYVYRVLGPLLWLGEANPLENSKSIIAEDPVRSEIETIMQLWWEAFGDKRMKTSEVVNAIGDGDFDSILREVAGDKYGKPSSMRLGRWLRRHKDRIVGAKRFVQVGEADHSILWKLQQIGP